MDKIEALITEAKRQRRKAMSLRVFVISEAWVFIGILVRHRPFRWLWQARAAWLLHTLWNHPKGHQDRHTLKQDWVYARGLSEILDEAGEGFLSPSEAIAEDRQYWED